MREYFEELGRNLAFVFVPFGIVMAAVWLGWELAGTPGIIVAELLAVVVLIALSTWMYRR